MKLDQLAQSHRRLFNSRNLLKFLFLGGSVALLGASCWKGVKTNTNAGVENINVAVNENEVAGNFNGEVNINPSANTNSVGEIDTSDWLVYTSQEYGFSVQYPKDWVVFNKIDFDNQGYLILDEENLSYLRFTSQKNNPSPETSFRDISIGVKGLEDFKEDEIKASDTDKTLFFRGEKYVIIIGATFPGEYELKVLEAMYDSLTF